MEKSESIEGNKVFACESTFESVQTIQSKTASKWLGFDYDSILEVGCSMGYFTKFLECRARSIYGVDINDEHIQLAQKKYPSINFQTCDAAVLPFPDETFDVIVMLEVLEHVGDDISTISEIHRILKKDGTLIMSVPNTGLFAFLDPFNVKMRIKRLMPGFSNKLSRIKNSQFRDNMDYHRHYSFKQIDSMLRYGFKIEKKHRGGFLIFPVCSAFQSIFSRIMPWETPKVLMQKIMNLDGAIRYSSLSYNLIVMARKDNEIIRSEEQI